MADISKIVLPGGGTYDLKDAGARSAIPAAYASNPAMDGTASPGSSGNWARGDHVHPSDTGKANEAQLAYVESGSTASRAYSIGEYFCWGGTLYRAKAAISSGASFTVGTNCEVVTAGGMNELKSALQRVLLWSNPSPTSNFPSSIVISGSNILAPYKFIGIEWSKTTNDRPTQLIITPVRTGGLNITHDLIGWRSDGVLGVWYRSVVISLDGITIYNGSIRKMTETTYTEDSSVMIPIKIWGIP